METQSASNSNIRILLGTDAVNHTFRIRWAKASAFPAMEFARLCPSAPGEPLVAAQRQYCGSIDTLSWQPHQQQTELVSCPRAVTTAPLSYRATGSYRHHHYLDSALTSTPITPQEPVHCLARPMDKSECQPCSSQVRALVVSVAVAQRDATSSTVHLAVSKATDLHLHDKQTRTMCVAATSLPKETAGCTRSLAGAQLGKDSALEVVRSVGLY